MFRISEFENVWNSSLNFSSDKLLSCHFVHNISLDVYSFHILSMSVNYTYLSSV